MEDIKIIRDAIIKNRGGHEQTSDAGIMFLFNSLTQETREQYLKSLNTGVETKNKKTEKE